MLRLSSGFHPLAIAAASVCPALRPIKVSRVRVEGGTHYVTEHPAPVYLHDIGKGQSGIHLWPNAPSSAHQLSPFLLETTEAIVSALTERKSESR